MKQTFFEKYELGDIARIVVVAAVWLANMFFLAMSMVAWLPEDAGALGPFRSTIMAVIIALLALVPYVILLFLWKEGPEFKLFGSRTCIGYGFTESIASFIIALPAAAILVNQDVPEMLAVVLVTGLLVAWTALKLTVTHWLAVAFRESDELVKEWDWSEVDGVK